MARFRSRLTGSILNVSDEVGRTLGGEFEPFERPAPAPVDEPSEDVDTPPAPTPRPAARRQRKH